MTTVKLSQIAPDKIALALCGLFFLVKVVILFSFPQNILWDEAVYVNSAIFIRSGGAFGALEPARPLLLPLFLTVGGQKAIIFGRLLSLFFASGILYLSFILARLLVKDYAALWTMIAIAITPSFFFFSGKIMTELPSLFFVLLGLYFLYKEKVMLAGVLLSFGFLTRYFSLFLIIPLLLFWFAEHRNSKKMVTLITSFCVPVFLLLILFYIVYGSASYPFELQVWLTKNTGWMFSESRFFYLFQAIKDNYLYVFSIIGAGALISKRKEYVMLAGFGYFFIMQLSLHKELRFLLLLLPFSMILAAYALQFLIPKQKWIWGALLALLFVFSSQELVAQEPLDYATQAHDKVLLMNLSTEVAVSNPVYVTGLYVKQRIFYYPLLNSSVLEDSWAAFPLASSMVISSCDIICAPTDLNCPLAKQQFLGSLNKKYVFKEEFTSNKCIIQVYTTS